MSVGLAPSAAVWVGLGGWRMCGWALRSGVDGGEGCGQTSDGPLDGGAGAAEVDAHVAVPFEAELLPLSSHSRARVSMNLSRVGASMLRLRQSIQAR